MKVRIDYSNKEEIIEGFYYTFNGDLIELTKIKVELGSNIYYVFKGSNDHYYDKYGHQNIINSAIINTERNTDLDLEYKSIEISPPDIKPRKNILFSYSTELNNLCFRTLYIYYVEYLKLVLPLYCDIIELSKVEKDIVNDEPITVNTHISELFSISGYSNSLKIINYFNMLCNTINMM